MGEGDAKARWWHAAVLAAVASAGTFVQSHWGGATHDDLGASEARTKSFIEERITKSELKSAGESDNLKKYFDKQLLDMEGRLAAPVRKKRKGDGQ